MTKRKSKKIYKGGFWPFSSETSYDTSTSWTDWFNNKTKNAMTSADSAISNAANSVSNGVSNLVDSTNKALSTDIPLTQQSPQPILGGKRRRRKTKTKKNKKSLKRSRIMTNHASFL
jgi:hypothetical protein